LNATQKLLRFGTFTLNLDTEELRKDGTLIKLAPQPIRLLALLASRAGQVVSREEIQRQLWGDDTHVDFEHGMNQCINQIRGVLNDNADRPVYVETIPRRGYRFLAPVVSKTLPIPLPKVVESQSGIQELPRAFATEPSPGGERAASPPVAPQTAPTAVSTGTATAAALAPEAAPIRKPGRRWSLLRPALAVVVCIAAVVVAGLYWTTHRVAALNEKDTVVLADFTNSTGDKVFDDTLKTALSFQLEQSPFLNVLSDHTVATTLRLMDRPPNQRVTGEIARELCLRTNSKAVVAGSIAAVGPNYLVGLKATDCQTGDTLVSAAEEARNQEGVLKAVSVVGNELRGKLGESLASVARFNKPLEQATTSSLDALEAYSRGLQLRSQGESTAIPYFERAVELDPNFAAAYLTLGTAYYNLQEQNLAVRNLTRAYDLRDRVSERERWAIEGAYYGLVTGEIPKAIQTYSEWAQAYPRDAWPHANLGTFYTPLGKYDRAVAEMQEQTRLTPGTFANANLLLAYAALDRLSEAQDVFDQAHAEQLDDPVLRVNRYLLAFLQGKPTAMQDQLAWAMGKPGVEDQMMSAQSDTDAYYGRFTKARDDSQFAVESARRSGAPEAAAVWKANAALREAEVGNFAQARQQAAEALALSDGRSVRVMAALAFARAGDAAHVQKLAEKLDQEAPLDSIIQGYWLPSIRAAMELDKDSPDQAITTLKLASSYELGTQAPFGLGPMYPVYLRGLALLRAGNAQAAAAEFQRMVDHPGIAGNFVLLPLAYLQLGRAQMIMGDKNAARKSYQNFLAIWKDASPDIPIFNQAKAEYAKL
jgi:eukaryotic-like serine/threonine-protein kinase